MKKEKIVSLLLRIGLAIVFGYAGIAAFFDPTSWIGYFPVFIRQMIPAHLLLPIFSTGELVLALWLLSGRAGFFAGLVSAALTLGIIASNAALFDIIFRDVAIFFASIALAYLYTEDTNV